MYNSNEKNSAVAKPELETSSSDDELELHADMGEASEAEEPHTSSDADLSSLAGPSSAGTLSSTTVSLSNASTVSTMFSQQALMPIAALIFPRRSFPTSAVTLKTLMIGASSNNRVQFVNLFAHGDSLSKYLSTIGIDFQARTVDDTKHQVFDMVGYAEYFRTLSLSLYRDTDVILIMPEDDLSKVNNLLKKIQEGATAAKLVMPRMYGLNYSNEGVSLSKIKDYDEIYSQATVTLPATTASRLSLSLFKQLETKARDFAIEKPAMPAAESDERDKEKRSTKPSCLLQ